MVLTNYECWACSEKDNNTCDIMFEQVKPKMQIDLFNPRVLNACGITQKESHSQQYRSRECFAKVSQISSNGYYGFMYVKENDEHAFKNVLGVNGNLHENVGMSESSTSLTENIRTFACNNISNSKQKRSLQEDNISNDMCKNIKRCRLEAGNIIQNSCTVPLNESTANMEVDEVELHKDTKSLTITPSLHQVPVSYIPFPSDKKNYSQHSYPSNFTNETAEFCITTDIKNRNPKSIGEKLCQLEYNSTNKPELYAFNTEESGISRINKTIVTELDDDRNKNFENEKMFIERMFSETHGGGIYCLQNVSSTPNEQYDI